MQERKIAKSPKRLLALVLAVVMLLGLAVPASATGIGNDRTSQAENASGGTLVTDRLVRSATATADDVVEEQLDPNEMVRVSIVLEKDSTLEAGYSAEKIVANASAMSYRHALKAEQATITSKIEKATGEKLDVVWNLTLAANIISANVKRGDIETIAATAGVKEVVEEIQYAPAKISVGGELTPNMAVSSEMTGSTKVWDLDITGKGGLVAIIDTGLDYEHISFDNDAFLESIGNDTASLKLTKTILEGAVGELNASATADQLYRTEKIPFGYNYVDDGLRIDHKDSQGEHGSHVAGIAVANRLVKNGDKFVDAVGKTGVAGNAPDAQIMVMKVFGTGGGAYDSDYFAAVEDAIALGADSANLSLGSGNAGMTNSTYNEILDKLVTSGTIMVTSHGNNSSWGENTNAKNLFKDDVNYATGGSPGSFSNTLAVASVDNDGFVGTPIAVNGKEYGYTQSNYSNAPIATLDTSADGTGTELDFVFIDGVGTPEEFAAVGSSEVTGKIALVRRGTTSFYEKANAAVAAGAIATIIVNNQPGTINMDLSDYTGTAPCISITQDFGTEIWNAYASSKQTSGGVDYITGKMTVYGAFKALPYGSANLTMSSFSSWGPTGNLALKPEITAPGGNILSVWGYNTASESPQSGHDQYELMSGTSMAAPQISGITSLVMQRLREDGIQGPYYPVANALMMSTASPITYADGHYTSVLSQGAGLANAYGAVKTPVYITMDGRTDGKAKAELGDDPAREGVYTVDFVLNNLSAESQSYTLDAKLFTQEISGNYMTTGTQDLPGTVTFSPSTVTVAGNSTAKVTATITLDKTAAQALDTQKDGTGFYVEGYIFAKPASTAEGVEGVELSIPVLGYYGSWTDPSMFDNDGDYFGKPATFASNGTVITGFTYSLIRNAGASAVVAKYNLDGEEVTEVVSSQTKAYYAAYYSATTGSWSGTSSSISCNWDSASVPADAEDLTISLVMVPEYYAKNGTYDIAALTDGDETNGELGDGAYLTFPVELDLEPPVIEDADFFVDASGNIHITATVSDDTSVVDVCLFEADMETIVRELNPAIYGGSIGGSPNFTATAPNQKVDVEFDGYYDLNSFLGIIYYDEYVGPIEPGVYYIDAMDASGNDTIVRVLAGVEPTEYVESIAVNPTALEMLNGTTSQLKATVLPTTVEDDSVVWTSSNEAVATVDENGLVTATGLGAATITATTIATTEGGETLSASCDVVVSTLALTLTGVLGDEDGYAKFFEWDFETGELKYGDEKESETEYPVALTEYTGSTYLTVDTNGVMYELDYDGNTVKASEGAPYAEYLPDDMAYTKDAGYWWTLFGFLLNEEDPFAPEMYGFNLQSHGEFIGLAFDNSRSFDTTYQGDVVHVERTVYLLTKAKTIKEIYLYNNGQNALISTVPTDLTAAWVGYEDASYSNMVLGSDGALYASIMTGDTNEVYRLVYNESSKIWESTRLGDFGDGVWPALLLSVMTKETSVKYDFDNNGVVNGKDAQLLLDHVVKGTAIDYHVEDRDVNEDGEITTRDVYELLVIIGDNSNTVVLPAGVEKITAKTFSAAELKSSKASGSLNSVKTGDVEVDDTAYTVTIPVYASASTNGLATIEYDAAQMTYSGYTKGELPLVSVDAAKGEITIGYAHDENLSNDLVVELSFTYKPSTFEQIADVTITVEEEGDEAAVIDEPEQPVLPEIILPGEVKPLPADSSIIGVLSDESVQTQFFKWPANSAPEYSYPINTYELPIAAAKADDDSYYALDINYNMHKMALDSDTELSVVNGWTSEDNFIPADIAINETDGSLWMVYKTYILKGIDPDGALPEEVSGFNMKDYGYPYFYGIDIVEAPWTMEDEDTGEVDSGDYYIVAMSDINKVFVIYPYETPKGTSAWISQIPVVGVDSMHLYGEKFASVLAMSDEELYISFIEDESSALYHLVFDGNQFVGEMIGDAGTDVYPASLLDYVEGALHYDFDGNEVVDELDAQLLMDHIILGTKIEYCVDDIDADRSGEVDTRDVHFLLNWLAKGTVGVGLENVESVEAATFSVESIANAPERDFAETKAAASTNGKFGGMLNSVASNVTITGDGETPVITVPVKVQGTNGDFMLNYNAELLTLVSVECGAEIYAVNDTEAGIVRIGYAYARSGSDTIEVVFSYDASKETTNTEIELIVDEDGTDKSHDQDTTIEVVLTHIHKWSEAVKENEVAATCAEEGSYDLVVYCAECGDELSRETKIVDKLPHGTTITVGARPATKTHYGYTGDIVCAECGEVLEEGEIIPATGEAGKPTDGKFDKDDEDEKPVVTTPKLPFTDVKKSDEFYDSILYVYEKSLMNGTGATTFSPDKTLNRATVAQTLYRLAGEPAVTFSNLFTDVAAGDWYDVAVEWAANAGIVNGYGNGKFGPTDPVTREQLAAMLYRYAQYKGMDAVTTAEYVSGYSDGESVSTYAVAAMNWALSQDLIPELASGKLAPAQYATRAEVAYTLHHFMVNVLNNK